MGGYGALRNGILFSDTFSHIAGLSSALHIFDDLAEEAHPGLFDDLKEASKSTLNPVVAAREMFREKKDIPRFYMACGRQDDLMKVNEDFRDFLREQGADVVWDEEDAGHDWVFWDSQIRKVLDWLPL